MEILSILEKSRAPRRNVFCEGLRRRRLSTKRTTLAYERDGRHDDSNHNRNCNRRNQDEQPQEQSTRSSVMRTPYLFRHEKNPSSSSKCHEQESNPHDLKNLFSPQKLVEFSHDDLLSWFGMCHYRGAIVQSTYFLKYNMFCS